MGLSAKKRLTLHLTSTYASWLDQTETGFNIVLRDVAKGGACKTVHELIHQIMLYIKQYNKDRARPFTWTYTGNVRVV